MVGACAPKRDYTPATVPDWDVVQNMALEPPEELSPGQQRDFEEGWRSLQLGDLETAASELEDLSGRYGRSAEIATARGFLELRLGSAPAASRYFESALRARPDYAPALGGYLLTALSTGDDELAYDRLETLQENHPQHPLVERYETTLMVNVAETRLARARELSEAGQYEEAAEAYVAALEVAPGVGALYLEAAEAELAAGLVDRAVQHAERATELDPDNARAYRVLGEAHYAGNELEGAYEAYLVAAELDPRSIEIRARLESIERQYQEENLPPEYTEIEQSERVNRAQLAALLYLELRDAFQQATDGASVIATDIANHWASDYIRRVLGLGILEVYPNHTFQPGGFVRRVELAEALARALERLSPASYRAAKQSSRFDQEFSDLAPTNAHYDAAALAVSLGLLMVRGDGFEPQGFVSGAEAAAAVEALAAHLAL